jgi:hypothetical protein
MRFAHWLAALVGFSMVLAACGPSLSDAGAPNGQAGQAGAPDGGAPAKAGDAPPSAPPARHGGW